MKPRRIKRFVIAQLIIWSVVITASLLSNKGVIDALSLDDIKIKQDISRGSGAAVFPLIAASVIYAVWFATSERKNKKLNA